MYYVVRVDPSCTFESEDSHGVLKRYPLKNAAVDVDIVEEYESMTVLQRYNTDSGGEEKCTKFHSEGTHSSSGLFLEKGEVWK